MATATRTKRSGPNRQATSNRWAMYVAGVAVVLVAVLIAVLTANETGSAVRTADLAGSPTALSDPLPEFGGDPATDPAVGQPAPLVEGANFEGEPVTIGEPGTPQLLMFLASWCSFCQEELPQVVDWLDAGNLPEGVEMTAVITGLDDRRPNWPPTDWLDEEGYTGRVLVDDADGTVAQQYGLSGTPYWVAIDADGNVVARSAGLLSMEQLDALAAAIAPR